jgi:hypothetical protein
MQGCAASEQRENTLKGFKDFNLKAKAGIWPWLSYMCHIRYSADSSARSGEEGGGVHM